MSFSVRAGIRRISLDAKWMALAAGLLAYDAAADSAFISVPLQRTGADTNAGGLVTINLGTTNSSLTLQASNLTAGRACAVFVGGVLRGRFTPNASGRGGLRFARPSATGALPFDFDPRGRQLLLLQNDQIVLRARISGPGEPRGSVVNEQVRVPRVFGSFGRAEAQYELPGDGTRRFSVVLNNVESGAFTLFVNGIRRGDITAAGGGVGGTMVFDNVPETAGPALNFDPRGVVIDIAKDNALRFSGKFLAKADGISLANTSVSTRVIPAATVSPSSIALARRWVDRDARREFDVELFNVPPGEYELYVNGVLQGFIPAFAGEGEMQFSTDPDDEDERPLSFNPFNSFYTVVGAGGLFFQGQPAASAVAITNEGVMPSEIELPMFNLGADADGTARVQLKTDDRGRRHFEVELRNLPRGNYSLLIDRVPFGTIQVVAEESGTRGLIEYEDEPEVGELLLSFDPLGTTIGVARDGTRYFERRFPAAP